MRAHLSHNQRHGYAALTCGSRLGSESAYLFPFEGALSGTHVYTGRTLAGCMHRHWFSWRRRSGLWADLFDFRVVISPCTLRPGVCSRVCGSRIEMRRSDQTQMVVNARDAVLLAVLNSQVAIIGAHPIVSLPPSAFSTTAHARPHSPPQLSLSLCLNLRQEIRLHQTNIFPSPMYTPPDAPTLAPPIPPVPVSVVAPAWCRAAHPHPLRWVVARLVAAPVVG